MKASRRSQIGCHTRRIQMNATHTRTTGGINVFAATPNRRTERAQGEDTDSHPWVWARRNATRQRGLSGALDETNRTRTGHVETTTRENRGETNGRENAIEVE